jgi:hypothetical protein
LAILLDFSNNERGEKLEKCEEKKERVRFHAPAPLQTFKSLN